MAEVLTEEPVAAEENEFSKASVHSDVILIVEGRQLHVSKVVLAIVSPVFEAMFKDEHGTKAEVQLPGKKYNDVVEFLRCIYPQITKPVTDEWLEALLTLADEYQCSIVRQRCVDFLQKMIGVHNSSKTRVAALRWLRIADKVKLPEDMLQRILRFIINSTEFREIEQEAQYQELEIHVQKRLLRAYVLKLELHGKVDTKQL